MNYYQCHHRLLLLLLFLSNQDTNEQDVCVS